MSYRSAAPPITTGQTGYRVVVSRTRQPGSLGLTEQLVDQRGDAPLDRRIGAGEILARTRDLVPLPQRAGPDGSPRTSQPSEITMSADARSSGVTFCGVSTGTR